MKILIISQCFYPETFLINDITFSLASRGYDVEVITGLPNYPTGCIPTEYRHHKKRNEVIQGTRVRRCGIVPRKNSALGLFLNYISFVISACLKVLTIKHDYDVVYCYQLSPVTQAIPAILAAKMAKCRLLLYCLDIFPESVKSHISGSSFIYKLITWVSKSIYKKCDKIAVSSPAFEQYLTRVNDVCPGNMVYIPQHAKKIEVENDTNIREKDKTNFLFAGNIGYGQNLSVLVNAVCQLRKMDSFIVHIVGDGSKLSQLQQEVKDNHVEDKFVFYGRKAKEEMPTYYHLADVLLITLRGDNEVSNTLPSKMQEYMSAGKPIVGSANGAVKDIIEQVDVGICAPANDAEGLAQAMKNVIDFPEKYRPCGERAVAYFDEYFSLEKHIDKLTEQLECLQ